MNINFNRPLVSATLGIVTVLSLTISSVFAIHANDGAELPVVEKNGVVLSFKGSVMGVNGQSDEYVYAGRDYINPDYKVSELNWDISSLWMMGGTMSLQMGELIRLNAGAWVGITEGDGGMEDYDWMEPSISDWTHYSESDVDIKSAFSYDINGSIKLFDLGACQLHGVVGYKHDFWEWSDHGGTYIYSSGGFRNDIGSFNGENGIDYEQTFDIPYAGIKASAKTVGISASGYALYSPIVSAEDKDHHIMRNLYFTEEFEDGDYFALGGEVTIELTDALFISASIDYQTIPEFTGDLSVKEGSHGVTSTTEDGAGIGNTITAIAASAGLRF